MVYSRFPQRYVSAPAWVLMPILSILGLYAFSSARAQFLSLSTKADIACSRGNEHYLARPGRVSALGDNFDVGYYRLELKMNPPQTVIQGILTVDARGLEDTLRTVSLDLSGNMTVDSVTSPTGRLLAIRHSGSIEAVLPRPFLRGELMRWTVHYHGVPSPSGFGSFMFGSHNGNPWVWSLSEPYGAPDWWPCKDVTTDKADSMDILVTCPQPLKVGANGLLIATTDNGDGTTTFHWAERYPIATYLVSITAADFATFSYWYRYSPSDSMEVLNYILPDHVNQARPTLAKTPFMIAAYSALFGQYPFIKEKYGHCEFGWGGAMEHQTMTSTTTFNEYTISHELGHQWFGDLITCANWQELWLNEGFASYCESLWRESYYGKSAYFPAILPHLINARAAVGTLFVQDTTVVGNLFSGPRVYSKGAAVLHMLRHVLGDSAFFRSLRAYVADPALRYHTATTAQFRSVCERITGVDLGYFFDEWVFGEKYPQYGVAWTASTNATHQTAVTVVLNQTTQTANPSFFEMPVDLKFQSGAVESTVVVHHQYDGQSFVFTFGFRPDSVIVDPNNWIVHGTLGPSDIVPAGFSLEGNYPNPFNGTTTIRYALPFRTDVELTVLNILGEKVKTLLHERKQPKTDSTVWDGMTDDGKPAPSGMYFCRMVAGGYASTIRIILLR